MTVTDAGRRFGTDPAQLTGPARAAHDEIVAKRGALAPPYRVLIESPAVGLAVEGLSTLLGSCSLSSAVRESIHLIVARRMHCRAQWARHEVKALEARVTPEDIAAIATGRPPPTPGLRTACQVAERLVGGDQVDDLLWQEALDLLGKSGLAELCAFVGLATTVAVAINLQDPS